MAETKYISLANLQKALDEVKERVVLQQAGKGLSTNDLTNQLKAQYDQAVQKVAQLEATGGQANVIETIKVNGSALTPDVSKAVDITVPTKVSELTNDSNYVTSEEMAAQVSSVYKPAGNIPFASLPALSEAVLGNVYNVTDAFNTTEDFVEGAGQSHPAGTNVVVVDTGSGVYKFDVLAGFVDLTAYAKTTDVTSAIATAKQEAITQAGTATDNKLLNYVKTSDLVPATDEEIEAMFASWTA